jgi:hypothetical protein
MFNELNILKKKHSMELNIPISTASTYVSFAVILPFLAFLSALNLD